MSDGKRGAKVPLEEEVVRKLEMHMDIEDQEKARSKQWHMGKEIPLALVGTLILQTVGVVWGAATLNAKVESNEKAGAVAQIVQASVDRRQDEEARRSEDRILAQLEKLNGKLDRIMEGKK